jgi:hypothetical protein
MDFRTVTQKLVAAFGEQRIRYALIGGYAVGLWGVHRGTVDMDFLVRRDDMERVHRIMESLGYEVRFASENVTQYESALTSFGEIDYLHAFREVSLQMLDRAVEREIFNDGIAIRVLVPEDLIGLKVQAFSNNPSRDTLDTYDIEELMRIHSGSLDWDLVEGYFALFDLLPRYEALKRKYHAAD